MRIISGFLKGKKIKYLKNKITRPLKDSVKENIFNILKHSNLIDVKIEKSNILDLYSGVGSFGIECISRGAKKVSFIEKDINTFKILKENLVHLSIIEKSNLFNNDISDTLKKEFREKYNIFFFDPPYLDKDFVENLKIIKTKNIFYKNHIIIIHREKKTNDNFENLINIIDEKIYGRSKVLFGLFD